MRDNNLPRAFLCNQHKYFLLTIKFHNKLRSRCATEYAESMQNILFGDLLAREPTMGECHRNRDLSFIKLLPKLFLRASMLNQITSEIDNIPGYNPKRGSLWIYDQSSLNSLHPSIWVGLATAE